ncbi:hypothetical protein ADK65_19395 [Streptomyces sp. NRRL B-1140]|nr:hypothetical protein ADK65_19395 [Streptomyces sp. NRRL B-1140]
MICTTSVAIGERERYVYAVRPPDSCSVHISRPLATPRSPSGTVRRKVKSALSEGWSLQGKTVCATSGWQHTANPSGVATQPPAGGGVRRGSAP